MSFPSRRTLIAAGGCALGVASCGRRPAASAGKPAVGPAPGAEPHDLAWAAAGRWRSEADRRRDAFRHPVATLTFLGLGPRQTVVELWPGAGWYTEVLAPYLHANGGRLYAATLPVPNPDDPAAEQVVADWRARFLSRPELYGAPMVTSFGAASGPLCPPGAADLCLSFRNLHNWMAAGVAEKMFRDAYAALKPGGRLGLEEHRAPSGGAQDPQGASGYVQEAYARQLAAEAGFRFEAASEINANPRDDHEHPFGVWTLPPTRRSSPRGAPPNPRFDHRPYDRIGESDRMTLRFRKPL